MDLLNKMYFKLWMFISMFSGIFMFQSLFWFSQILYASGFSTFSIFFAFLMFSPNLPLPIPLFLSLHLSLYTYLSLLFFLRAVNIISTYFLVLPLCISIKDWYPIFLSFLTGQAFAEQLHKAPDLSSWGSPVLLKATVPLSSKEG